MTIAERIAALRSAEGMTQSEFAAKMGVSQATVSVWESGARVPSGEAIVAMARLFDTSTDFLLGLVDDQVRLVPYFRDTTEDEQLLLQAYAQLTTRQKHIVEELVASLAEMDNER